MTTGALPPLDLQPQQGPLGGPTCGKALIVENQFFVVIENEEVLAQAGFEEVSTFATVSHALDWLEVNRPQIAVIDHRLRDRTSEPLILKLQKLSIPTLVYSGIDCHQGVDEAAVGQVEWISKPACPDNLLSAIARVTRNASARL